MYFTKHLVQLPYEILTAFRENWPHVRLHLSSTGCFSVLSKGLPTANITTIHFIPQLESKQRDELGFKDLQLKDCVVSAPNLTHLTTKLECSFDPSKGRLPPIKSLRLEGRARWVYSFDDARRIWNFSRLEALYLEELDFEAFTRSILPTDFPKLQTIQVYQRKTIAPHETFGACELLGKFLQELPLIKVIMAMCYYAGSVIDAFSTPNSRVRLLHVRNYTQIAARTLRLSHIEKIGCTFPGLRSLFVDIEYFPRNSTYISDDLVSSTIPLPLSFMLIFLRWETKTRSELLHLSTLKSLNTLYISMVAGPWAKSNDLDYERIRNMAETYFRPSKTGQPLRKLSLRQIHFDGERNARVWDYFRYYWDIDGRRYFLPFPSNGFRVSDDPMCITCESN
jgi:hypothetical protein